MLRNIALPIAGELAVLGARRAWQNYKDYRHYTAPAVFSQKINQMYTPIMPKRKVSTGRTKERKSSKDILISSSRSVPRMRDISVHRNILNTPGGGFMRVKRRGAISSRSGGIIRRLRKVKRRSKKRKMLFKGVEKTVEAFKNEGTQNQSLNFGHGTHSRVQVLEMAWKAVIKAALLKMRVNINSWDDPAMPFSLSPAIWRVIVGLNVNGAVTNTTFYTPAVNSTYQDMVNWFADVTGRPWYDPGSEIILDNLQFQAGETPSPASNYAKFSLRNCRVLYNIKSTMKMQNRTINSTGNNESDDVDNVPVYGKIYEFKGTGLLRPRQSGDAIVAISATSGYYAPFDSGNYKEPIDALYYDKVKSAGKIKLEPGEIKTSYLTDSGSIFITTLCKIMSLQKANNNPTITIGKNRLYSVEKMIDTLADPNPAGLGIAIAVEVNNRYRFTAKSFDDVRTLPTFTRIAA